MAADITQMMQASRITPAAVHQRVSQLVGERQNYLDTIRNLQGCLQAIGITAPVPQPGEAEIGFKIPRPLFENILDGLLRELREERFIIRCFSEAATGSAESIVVRQISTSSPLFFFCLTAMTVASLAKAARWALDTWKAVEEIRHLRAQTQQIRMPRETDIRELFEKAINEKIETAIDGKVKELLPNQDEPRHKELANHLSIALRSMLARIERGLSIEIRYVPTLPSESVAASSDKAASAFAALGDTVPTLIFPPATADPILKLPQQAPES